jgi:hypothetical protein
MSKRKTIRRKPRSVRPDRRITPAGDIPATDLRALAKRLTYGGSSYHKLRPNNYGLSPPFSPRPHKSPCDDLRAVPKAEAVRLFREGVRRGMVSALVAGGVPKYVWAVAEDGLVFEAKTDPPNTVYHGYRLLEDDADMREVVLREWKNR